MYYVVSFPFFYPYSTFLSSPTTHPLHIVRLLSHFPPFVLISFFSRPVSFYALIYYPLHSVDVDNLSAVSSIYIYVPTSLPCLFIQFASAVMYNVYRYMRFVSIWIAVLHHAFMPTALRRNEMTTNSYDRWKRNWTYYSFVLRVITTFELTMEMQFSKLETKCQYEVAFRKGKKNTLNVRMDGAMLKLKAGNAVGMLCKVLA